MSEKTEYFRGPHTKEAYTHSISIDTGYRMRDGLAEIYMPISKWVKSASSTCDDIRQHCRPVPTEHEAIHGEPEPVLYYEAWKEGEVRKSGYGKYHHHAYKIESGVFMLWHAVTHFQWTVPDNGIPAKRIAFFKDNYTPCTEAEALASIGVEPAKPKWPVWYDSGVYIYCGDESEVMYIPRSGPRQDWTRSTYDDGPALVDSVGAKEWKKLSRDEALRLAGVDHPVYGGVEEADVSQREHEYPRYFKSHSGGVYQVVADETVAYWNCVKHTWEAVAGCKLSRLFKMPEITEAEAQKLIDGEKQEPEKPQFAIGTYLNTSQGIRLVISREQFGTTGLSDDKLFLRAENGARTWSTPNANGYSPWIPAEGDKLWDDRIQCEGILRELRSSGLVATMTQGIAEWSSPIEFVRPASFAPKEPAVEDDHVKHEKVAAKRKGEAWDCEFFLEEARDTPCLWQRCKCRNSGENGNYDPCDLVWKGNCTRREPAVEENQDIALAEKQTVSEPAEERWPVGTAVNHARSGEGVVAEVDSDSRTIMHYRVKFTGGEGLYWSLDKNLTRLAEQDEPTQGPAPADIQSPQGRKDQTMTQLLEWATEVECPSCGREGAVHDATGATLNKAERVFRAKCGTCGTTIAMKAKNWTGETDEGDRNMIARIIISIMVRCVRRKYIALASGLVGSIAGMSLHAAYPEGADTALAILGEIGVAIASLWT